ncbi:Signal transduction histidine-protein kinase ArlS [Calidithermus terrae]|uniref:histidine kinase n=1 Tax=Calidithermus terrae TaxID=1408545 RepID=A0A399EF77_9DEIN|nr:PAS domain S-box protein [Calidithermus terrae]RIH80951.1 Signal transduction histidine-protein kinase ArlS [Calidithermus terrae]
MGEGKAAGEPTPELENDYRLMFEAAGVGMAQIDPYNFRFQRVNRRFAEMTGYTREELLGMSALELTHPDDRDRNRAEWGKTLRGESPQFAIEKRYVRKDGGVIWVSVAATVLRDAGGHPLRAVSTVEDITERRHREANRELLAGISEDLGQLSGEEEIIRSVGAKLAAHLGLSCYHYVDVDEERAEVTVRHFWHRLEVPHVLGTYPIRGFISPTWLDRLRAGKPAIVNDVQNDLPGDTLEGAGLKAGAAAQKIGAYVAVPYSQDGRWKAYFAVADSAPRRWTSLEVELMQEVSNRVFPRIERARSEKALRESEERLRRVLDGMDEGFGLLAPDFTILEHNRQALRLDGRTREEIVGRSHWEVYPGTEASELGRLYKKAMAERVPVSLEHLYTWEEGRARWLEMRAYPTDDGLLAVFWRDVTERREAQDALRESEERYRTLFTSIDEGYAVVEVLQDENGAWSDFLFLEVNPAFVEQTGMEYPVGRRATELLGTPNPRWAQVYGQVAETGEPVRFEESEPVLGRVFDLYCFRLGGPGSRRVAVLFTDITGRKRAEQRREFLLKLSDALHPLSDPVEILTTVAHTVMDRFGADRCYYCEIEGGNAVIRRDASREGLPSVAGVYPLSRMPIFEAVVGTGRPFVVADARTSELLDEELRRLCVQLQVISFVDVPVVKDGRPVGVLCITQSTPREWSDFEAELAAEVAERTWAAVERARVEEALRESQARLQKAISIETVGVLFFSLTGRITDANEAFLRASGYSREELLGLGGWDSLTPPEFMEVTRRAAAELWATGETAPYEKQMLRKDGSRWWALCAPTRLSGQGRDPECVEFVIDITERKKAEQASAWLAAIVESSSDAIVSFDLEGRILSWNPAAEGMFGYSAAEVVGQRLERLVPAGLEAEQAAIAERVGRGEHVVQLDTLRLHKDGTAVAVSLTVSPIKDERGAVIAATAVIQDVRARKQAEAALLESRERLALTMEAGSLGIWDSDLLAHRTYWSPEQERLFGLEPGSFDGGFGERIHPDDRERVLRRLAEARAAGGDYDDEYRVVWPDGTVRWLAARGRVYRDAQGRAVRILGVNFDVTRRKEAEERLRASEARLQALVEAQKRFVADASHELRAPLATILGNLELVCRFRELPEEERRAALEDARGEADRMARLVNDLLALAKGDAGIRLRLEPLDLSEVLREALAEARRLARGHVLEAELPERLNLRGDRDRLKQLALILLENALKYTPAGGAVRLGLERSGGWAELRVVDTGVGIAPEDLPHVFERFWRADPARSREAGGTGLGLSIAQWIVEQHGGEIRLQSEPGKGTTAVVRLRTEVGEGSSQR